MPISTLTSEIYMEFLKALITVSEKAANIARLLRQNERLFQRLIEVKSDKDANPKFQEDFKTLADVLIQEMVKHDIGSQFPTIQDKIHGEENNYFVNQSTNGDVIIVEVKNTKEDTAKLLSSILDDDNETADLLATEIHRTVTIEEVDTKIPVEDFEIDCNDLGIWIDPIDGTNEYVKGNMENKVGEFYLKGLKCTTVLIGVYNSKGLPVIGVINQPFFEKGIDDGYQCNWGVCYQNEGNEVKISSIGQAKCNETKKICVGGGENESVLDLLKTAGYDLVITRGAGYKLLTITLGFADAYILSNSTTYLWDTCAPHAILRALDGNIVEMKGIITKEKNYIKYEIGDDSKMDNKFGIVAYKSETVLEKLMELSWENIF